MFPIGDDNSARRTMPVVTLVLIVLNVLFFFVELNGGDAFIRQWAFIPARFGQIAQADTTSGRGGDAIFFAADSISTARAERRVRRRLRGMARS